MTGRLMLLSFLDVVSCGLGAAILLFLIYVASPQAGDSGGSVEATVAAGWDLASAAPETATPGQADLSIRLVEARFKGKYRAEDITAAWEPAVPEGCTAERSDHHQGGVTFLLVCTEARPVATRQLTLALGFEQVDRQATARLDAVLEDLEKHLERAEARRDRSRIRLFRQRIEQVEAMRTSTASRKPIDALLRARAFEGALEVLRRDPDGNPLGADWQATVPYDHLGEAVVFDLTSRTHPVRFGGS